MAEDRDHQALVGGGGRQERGRTQAAVTPLGHWRPAALYPGESRYTQTFSENDLTSVTVSVTVIEPLPAGPSQPVQPVALPDLLAQGAGQPLLLPPGLPQPHQGQLRQVMLSRTPSDAVSVS